MVTGRVSQRGQAMFVAVAQQQSDDVGQRGHHGGEHRDAGPQPVSGGDHQPGAEADEHQRRFDKRRFPTPRRARTGLSLRRSPRRAHRPVPDAEGIPGRGDRGFVGRTGGQEVSGERVGDRRCGELAQRHGGRYPTPHPYRGGRWLVRHAGIIGVVV